MEWKIFGRKSRWDIGYEKKIEWKQNGNCVEKSQIFRECNGNGRGLILKKSGYEGHIIMLLKWEWSRQK